MKTLLVLLTSGASAFGGAFLNLDFENPDLSHVQASSGPTGELLRGWNFKREDSGGIPPTMSVGPGWVFPMSLTSSHPSIPGTGVEFGKYSLYIGAADPSLTPPYRLSQSGLIPPNAESLIFYLNNGYANPLPRPTHFQCLVNGEATTLRAGLEFSHVYYADVSPYAGQEVNLEFLFGNVPRNVFDTAGFTSIPEPSTYAMFGLGAGAKGWHLRRRK